ncbi:hypothetical protein [Rosettibacter firmus]|uniref:hypothetical protein n=1 Tax=Rosettibacter firmus TaxID=3111522 RepID=UPI00336BD7F9
MKPLKTNRRIFLKSFGSLAALSFLSFCENSRVTEPFFNDNNTDNNSSVTSTDLVLSGSEQEIASNIKMQYSLIEYLAKNTGKEKVIAYYDNGLLKKLSISIVKGNLASYPYLRLTKQENNESVNILWGMEGIYPSLKFVDDNGKIIEKENEKLEFALKKTDDRDYTPMDWLKLGVKIFAFGLLVWLGATVLKYVIAAIAFVAFNALVLGIVIAGLTLIIPFVKWLIDRTGWTKDSVKDFFNNSFNEILNFLLEIQRYLLER